jgi:hypothetical protein
MILERLWLTLTPDGCMLGAPQYGERQITAKPADCSQVMSVLAITGYKYADTLKVIHIPWGISSAS